MAVGPGDVAGVGTVSLQRSRQLRLSFWNFASVVVCAPPGAGTVTLLEHTGHPGALGDRRGPPRRGNDARVPEQGLTYLPAGRRVDFVGLNRGGHPLSVFYFPGRPRPRSPRAKPPRACRPAAAHRRRPRPAGRCSWSRPRSGGLALRDILASSPDLEIRPLGTTPGSAADAGDASEKTVERLRAALDGDRRALVHRPPTCPGAIPARRLPGRHLRLPLPRPGPAVPAALAAWESGWDASPSRPAGLGGPPWSFALSPAGGRFAAYRLRRWSPRSGRPPPGRCRPPAAAAGAVVGGRPRRADRGPGAELARLGRFAGRRDAGGAGAARPTTPPCAEAEVAAALERTIDTAKVAGTLFASAAGAPGGPPPAAPAGVASASLTQVLARRGPRSWPPRRRLRWSSAGPASRCTPRLVDSPAALACHDGVLAVGTRAA